MRAGTLRHRIKLQSPEQVQDPDTGAASIEWIDVGTVWASIEPLSAREFIAAQASQSEVTARIVMRYREGISASMRAIHRGKVYNIHGVLADKKSGVEYLTLPVSEGVDDG